jgi:hypothetical protein
MPEGRTFGEVPLGEPMTFVIERGDVQPGRTFSDDAVRALVATMTEFVLTQVAVRWEQTNEPPTALTVTVRCDVS